MNTENQICDLIQSLESLKRIVSDIDQCGAAIVKTFQEGGKTLICGNGGSAADALHLTEELVGKFRATRRPLPAHCLNADPTTLTCIGNDYGFESIFSRQVEAYGKAGDMLIAISTSGSSPNILNALKTAKEKGLTIALLTSEKCKAPPSIDHVIKATSQHTERIQEMHTLIYHSWLESVDAAFS